MSNKVYPSEIIESTVEYHLAKNTLKIQIIYTSVILAFVFTIASLPFIYVNVTVKGTGIIRPISEKTDVKSLVSGTISQIKIEVGQFVTNNDTLIIVQSDKLVNQTMLLEKQKSETEDYIQDLESLIALKANTFKSDKYHGEYFKFKDQVTKIKNQIKKAKKN